VGVRRAERYHVNMSEVTSVIPVRAEVVRDVKAEDFFPLFTVTQAVERKQIMNQFINDVLKEGEDYGYMPGDTRKEKKKVLLKPGAEKLCSIFGLAPRYVKETVIEDWTGSEHLGEALFYYEYRCQLYRGDRFMGEGIGSANSWEEKYRWRESKRKCPTCGAEAIIKGKEEYGGGWLCWKKNGGCGGKFADGDQSIEGQPGGRVPNPNSADVVNTCQKMGQKRAQVAAVLVVTNCSDAFTQDLESEEADRIDTGGHPVGTQAAADHVRDRKLADARAIQSSPSNEGKKQEATEMPVPVPLQGLFANLEKPGYMKQGLELMLRMLREAMPLSGEAEYRRLIQKHHVQKGCHVDVLKAAILEMWQVAEFARAQKAQTDADGKFHATDDDLPQFDAPKTEPEQGVLLGAEAK
jgi:hypothetical protein